MQFQIDTRPGVRNLTAAIGYGLSCLLYRPTAGARNTVGIMGAFDVEAARTVRNYSRVVDFVAEFIVEVGVVSVIRGINTTDVCDVDNALRLPDRICGKKVRYAHPRRGGWVAACITHTVSGFFQTGASGKKREVVLAEAVVYRKFAVAGEDQAQTNRGNQNQGE